MINFLWAFYCTWITVAKQQYSSCMCIHCAISHNIKCMSEHEEIYGNLSDRSYRSWAVDGRKHKMLWTFSDEWRKTLKKQADLLVTSALGMIVICVYVDIRKQGRQCMYNITLRLVCAAIVAVIRNEYYATWVCVFVTLGVQHAVRMHDLSSGGLSCFAVSFHIFSYTAQLVKKKYWTQNVCFDFLYNFRIKHFSF
jgi:hypothetical protein